MYAALPCPVMCRSEERCEESAVGHYSLHSWRRDVSLGLGRHVNFKGLPKADLFATSSVSSKHIAIHLLQSSSSLLIHFVFFFSLRRPLLLPLIGRDIHSLVLGTVLKLCLHSQRPSGQLPAFSQSAHLSQPYFVPRIYGLCSQSLQKDMLRSAGQVRKR